MVRLGTSARLEVSDHQGRRFCSVLQVPIDRASEVLEAVASSLAQPAPTRLKAVR